MKELLVHLDPTAAATLRRLAARTRMGQMMFSKYIVVVDDDAAWGWQR